MLYHVSPPTFGAARLQIDLIHSSRRQSELWLQRIKTQMALFSAQRLRFGTKLLLEGSSSQRVRLLQLPTLWPIRGSIGSQKH